MTDYTELVKALRCCGNINTDCTVCPWDKYNFGMCAEKLYTDAAAAIEELQAEIRESMQKCAECGAEPITLEQAIDRLHELGWLQEHDRILSQPHWVSVEELPKEEGRYWCANKFAGHWLFFAAWYWNNVSDYIGVPVGEEEKAGFVFGKDVVYPDYWMPIEPPQEEEHGN